MINEIEYYINVMDISIVPIHSMERVF